MEKHICPVCGKEFFKKTYKVHQAIYCCRECAYKGRTLGFTKRIVKTPYKCIRKQLRICPICQDEFLYSKSTQKYCSRNCFEVAHKRNMTGVNNPAYKDGRGKEKRGNRGADWETIRKEVYIRDNFICQKCGVKCESKINYTNPDNIIQCHHIEKFNGENNNNSNLITLCLKCHLKEHNGKTI